MADASPFTAEEMASPFTAEEICELRRLLEIEKVRKIVLLYSHLMDARDWSAMAQLYAEDAICAWGPYGECQGRATIERMLVDAHVGRLPYDGLHCTTNALVELTGPDTAVSRSYLTDVWPSEVMGPITHAGYPQNPVLLYAVYENDYRKIVGEWKITRSAIQFVWPERVVSADFPRPMEMQAAAV